MSLNRFRQHLPQDEIHRRKYDREYGLQHVAALAQQRSRWPVDPNHPVCRRGFDVVRCLPAEAVSGCLEQVLDADGKDRFRQLPLDDMTALLTQILSPAADQAIRAAFGSDYAVVFGGASTTIPVGPATSVDDRYSFLWHCDGGPQAQIKLLIYLDALQDHDGATDVIEVAASKRMALTGYNLCELDMRLADLTELAAAADVALAPERVVPEAGEAIVFNPRLVLHKGVAPTAGRRRLLTIGVIPFPAPWTATLPEFLPFIRQNPGFEFPNLSRPGT